MCLHPVSYLGAILKIENVLKMKTESYRKEPGALLRNAPCKYFIRLGSNPSNFSTETCLKQMKTSMTMANLPCLYSFWFDHKFLISKNKTSDWTTFKNRQLWRHGGNLKYINKLFTLIKYKITQDIHMYLNVKFHRSPVVSTLSCLFIWWGLNVALTHQNLPCGYM